MQPSDIIKQDICWHHQNGQCTFGKNCGKIHCGKIQTFTGDYKNCTPAPFCTYFDNCPNYTTCIGYHPGDEEISGKVGQYHCTLRGCNKGNRLCNDDYYHPPTKQSAQTVCRHWANGYCARGKNCDFAHPDPNPEKTHPSDSVPKKISHEIQPKPYKEALEKNINLLPQKKEVDDVFSPRPTNVPQKEELVATTTASSTTVTENTPIRREISVQLPTEQISFSNEKEKVDSGKLITVNVNGNRLEISLSSEKEKLATVKVSGTDIGIEIPFTNMIDLINTLKMF